MKKKAIIFGAGKTGRGFAAHLAHLGGYEVVLIDKDHQLVTALMNAGKFDIQVLGNESQNCTICPKAVYHINDTEWYKEMLSAGLLFSSVFGNNLEELAKDLAEGFKARYSSNPDKRINLITCENFTDAALFLKKNVSQKLDDKMKKWLNENVGFSESIVLRTCIEAGENQDPLTIMAQNFFELPCDGEAFKGEIPDVYGLKPHANFSNLLRRKIFTYNCINAVITYLGAKKGYTQLYEGGNDPKIIAIARQAAIETSEAQIAEFGFDRKEQYEWVEAAFTKFADTSSPDTISRNGADPARKLSQNDRLVGPSMLAIKHNIRPKGLLKGILAAFDFYDEERKIKFTDQISEKGIDHVLTEICGLSPSDGLFDLLKKEFENREFSE
jgi:mannitol-1-phosphate 5-dehydrogenase